jgi:hypothetical protein
VIKDPIVSFPKAGYSKMHNDNVVFNPAPEEALVPANLMIYQSGFCALSDCTHMDNPMTLSAPSQEVPRLRGLLSSSIAHQQLVNLTFGDYLEKQTSPSRLTTSSMYLPKASTKLWLRRIMCNPRHKKRPPRLVGDKKPTRGA